MAQDDSPNPVTAEDKKAELDFRYYQAKLGVWKVVLGTMIVGIAGIVFPFVSKLAELRQSEESANQQYIKDFFSTAINQDIELRIRFAHYFANLSGPDQKQFWKDYYKELKGERDQTRIKIDNSEEKINKLTGLPQNDIELQHFVRERDWALAEIGYQQFVSNIKSTPAAESDASKKERLYKETTGLVERLALLNGPLDENPGDIARFWELYRKELIGVESTEFAGAMIAIGKVLSKLVIGHLAPDQDFKDLSLKLLVIARRELADASRAAAAE